MNTILTETGVPHYQWWAEHRLRFNLILFAAAPVSFGCLLLVWATLGERLPCLEVTALTAMLGAIAFALGLALANVFYLFGPLLERLLGAHRPASLRRRLFVAGTVSSVLLIFSPVFSNLFLAFFGNPVAGSCM